MASLDPQMLTLGSAESALAFTRTGGGSFAEWDRFLTLDGKPAYHIGNICDTCAFFFQRLEGATRSLSAEQFAATLAAGPPAMERAWLERVGALLPLGEYVPFYTRMSVRLVTSGGPGDYYAEEQVATPRPPKLRLRCSRSGPSARASLRRSRRLKPWRQSPRLRKSGDDARRKWPITMSRAGCPPVGGRSIFY